MIAALRIARGAVSLAIGILAGSGITFQWLASLLTPAQTFLTKTIERREARADV
ncbi:hypothetical protein [Chachezhania antarctica]|uniref:hypothetical protein n=1 Tax=Chachezhania antarctica TaxID=2340860 RepID=UPI0013CE654C|nr:hypothetical protein [Chachezhania antarctica]